MKQQRSSFTRSLRVRLATSFSVLGLVFVLFLGLIAYRTAAEAGLPMTSASSLRLLILWWGIGSVLLTAMLGIFLAKQITEPLGKLTDELRQHDVRTYPWELSVNRSYAELEQLTLTMLELASAIRTHETALVRNERKFRETFDLVDIGLAYLDGRGHYVQANRKFAEMVGYSKEELIGKAFIEVFHPDERDVEFQALRDVLAGMDNIPKREMRYMRKDGEVCWARRSAAIVRDEDDKLVYVLVAMEDISQYLANQETLRSLNQSLKAIVETCPLAIYAITAQGIVILWNPAAERLFGCKESEVLGKSSPLVISDHEDSAPSLRDRVLAGETLHNLEITRRRDDGALIELSVSSAPLRGTEDRIIGVLVICTDVTEIMRTSRALNDQLRFTQELLEVIPNPIFYKDIQGRYLGFNRAWESFFGKKREDFVGKQASDLIPAQLADSADRKDAEVIRTGQLSISEVKITDANDELRQVLKHVSRFTSQDGTPAGTIGVLTDITELKKIEHALETSEARFRALTESAMDIVTVIDAEGTILYQSPSVKHLLGFDPEQMLGLNPFEMVHRDDVRALKLSFESLLKRGTGAQSEKPIEFRIRNKDGSWRMLESMGKNNLDNPSVRGLIINTRDVSDRLAIQQRMQHLAYHDSLTGLPNRSLLQDRVAQALSRADRSKKNLAVMFIDIDNFKNINDTLGHDVGDELLREIAKRLIRSVRRHDTIARQGGDEFIVLLEELDGQSSAASVAQKILDALRTVFVVGGVEQHVSGSIGLALFPQDGHDPQTLLKNADTAMFHGKSLGKNTYQFFTHQMNIAVKRRAELERSLRVAVKVGDFALHYQPQIDLNSGEIVAVEGLIRWNSMENGTLMPGDFIPLAEETGLISEIGEWVLREGCRQAKEWQDMGLAPRRMAINLSARQLNDKGFFNMVAQVLAETGLDANYLELEITESQVMRQAEGSIMLLNQLADMGIHLAVDDFGTGYSSLSYLKRLPIGKLKIDQSFIRDITVDPNDTAIVVAIINMAKSLDLDIIAEGIETAGQLTLLRAKGCGIGQGYYFSVPMSAAALLPQLQRRSVFADAEVAAF
jgi:diguanylate cyclase (GGDEF)-like protein/PAS domain S-box-containing protein